jgi:hypothetical protein
MNKKHLILAIFLIALVLLSTLIIVLTVLLVPRTGDRIIKKGCAFLRNSFIFLLF